MKLVNLMSIALILGMAGASIQALAKTHGSATVTKKVVTSKGNSKLGTDFDFEDQLVRGKYEYPDEAVATVENDKLLNDLLPVRKDFKDRLKEMSSRR